MLYIVATPIGNLEDISLRALRILGEVDFVLCEDTRVTKRLLNHYKINTPTISFHQHSGLDKMSEVIRYLREGKNLALVSDAGTPAISDPGGKLVQAVIDNFGEDVKIESVPGPSAVTAALSISGIPTDKFIFMGFPPHKKGRQTFIRKIIESEFPVVVYESKHRIIKFLEELRQIAENRKRITDDEVSSSQTSNLLVRRSSAKRDEGGKPQISEITSVVVCRELSKMHETVYRGDLPKIIEKIKSNQDDQKGEFVVIVGK
jgi:16S rRNA (cytidine1402-2'-O)-methyltransferase